MRHGRNWAEEKAEIRPARFERRLDLIQRSLLLSLVLTAVARGEYTESQVMSILTEELDSMLHAEKLQILHHTLTNASLFPIRWHHRASGVLQPQLDKYVSPGKLP
jgi:hypothetical protein